MSTLIQGLEGTIVMMDNILVFGSNREEHNRHLDEVLRTIKASGLKLNGAKCQFRKTELQFFEHIIGADGIKLDNSKASPKCQAPQMWSNFARCSV